MVALFDGDVDFGFAEVFLMDEPGGEASVGAAGGGVFGDAIADSEDAGVQVVLGVIGFGAENQKPGLKVFEDLLQLPFLQKRVNGNEYSPALSACIIDLEILGTVVK